MTTRTRKLQLARQQPNYLRAWLRQFRATISREHRQGMIDEIDIKTALATLNKPTHSEYPPLVYLLAAQGLQGKLGTGEQNIYLSELARHFKIPLRTTETDLLQMEHYLVRDQQKWQQLHQQPTTENQLA